MAYEILSSGLRARAYPADMVECFFYFLAELKLTAIVILRAHGTLKAKGRLFQTFLRAATVSCLEEIIDAYFTNTGSRKTRVHETLFLPSSL